MKYRRKPIVIDANQWFKNGDHPLDYSKPYEGLEQGQPRQFSPEERRVNEWEGDIVRYFRRPDVAGETACTKCGATMNEHGWIDAPNGGHTVCPGDWILTTPEGEYVPCKPDTFAFCYELHDSAMVNMQVNVTQALALLGIIQLALRHPQFKNRPTARFAKQFGEDLEKEIVRLDPKLAMACAAGWNKQFDR